MSTPVGVDISKHKFDAAAWLDGKYKTKTFPNTPVGIEAFIGWARQFEDPHVCLEATNVYGEALSYALADSEIRVSVVNPAVIAAFADTELSRSKTDKGDAKRIARYCAMHRPVLWQPVPRSERELTAMVRRLDNLLEMRQMEENRLAVANPAVQPSIRTLIDVCEEQIEQLRKQIRQHIDDDPDLRQRRDLLDSIPGIGPATIPVLIGLLGDVSRFTSTKHCVSYAGLTPVTDTSGVRRGATRLSKRGPALLRKALYMPAVVAMKHNPVLRDFAKRLKARGKTGKAVVCAVMRKLLSIACAVLRSGRPFDPNHALA